MNSVAIKDLERRYQTLVKDYQAGKMNEADFATEVDNLQFQDDMGRYWMIGAQTGAWHYYDGQAWHQANPHDADTLPFLDEQGRYWQRGTHSGDWYYYESNTGEWVKPAPNDPAIPGSTQNYTAPGGAPYQSHLHSTPSGPDAPSQMDGELFQDDEGRYWMMGSKTGQWYFYEYDGWHPAHEFQQRVAQPYAPPYQPQPQYGQAAYAPYAQPPYQQPYPGYAAQQPAAQQQPVAQQPVYQQQAAAPMYQNQQAAQPQAAPAADSVKTPEGKVVSPPSSGDMPNPPNDKSDSGSWYYFDGKQWLQYSSGEPANDVPPTNPEMILDQQPEPAKSKEKTAAASASAEPVVAELFEEEDDAEVVDVEVITVIEAEPDEEPEPAAPAPGPQPTARTNISAPPDTEEVIPRRVTHPVSRPVKRVETEPAPAERQPLINRERTSTEPVRPAAPVKRETAHEPTIIIPTDSAASSIHTPKRSSRPVRPVEPRRARENTVPMETIASAGASQAPREARVASEPHPDVTQPLIPKNPRTRTDTHEVETRTRTKTDEFKRARAREDTKDITPAAKPAVTTPPKTEKSGYTLGEILRAFPSTVWTFVGGFIVLLVFAFIIIAAFFMLNDNNSPGVNPIAVEAGLTPTMSAAMPGSTPTPGPTPAETAVAVAPTEVPTLITFDSPLGFSVDYPDHWQREETDTYVIISPSKNGLDPDNFQDAAIWIGTDTQAATIAEVLANTLTQFPADANTLNEGTISIASQTWTSAQIEFDDENMGGRGIATMAVTNKDSTGYFLVAVAPANQWNSVQPSFQQMINSFSFKSIQPPAVAAVTQEITVEPEDTTPTPEATAEAEAPAAAAKPITYIVKPGDTLLAIAVEFGVSADAIAAANGIENRNTLAAGQELIIPLNDEELATYLAEGSAGSGSTPATTEGDNAATEDTAPAPETAAAQPTAAPVGDAAPVGGRIVYPAFNPGTNTYDIWLADVASGSQSVLAGNASQPAFNKDGTLFAYRSWDLGTRGIFFRDFVGGRGGQVTRFVEDGLPTWAPDGFSFALMSRREGDRVARLYRGDQLGQGDTSIGFQGEYPSTMPDGRIVVKGCLPTGDCGIFIIGPNGGGEKKISGDGGDTAPAPSPDGSKIAFMSAGRGSKNWEIWVMSADGSNPQQLTNNGSNDGLPAWSPDGQSIAFVSDQGGQWAIWVMNADGSNQRKLLNMNGSPDGSVLIDTGNSRGWLEERISWAP